jgi:tryptophan halogenase
MLGQGITPRTYHPAVDWVKDGDVMNLVQHVEQVIAANVALIPRHEDFIARHCAAQPA